MSYSLNSTQTALAVWGQFYKIEYKYNSVSGMFETKMGPWHILKRYAGG